MLRRSPSFWLVLLLAGLAGGCASSAPPAAPPERAPERAPERGPDGVEVLTLEPSRDGDVPDSLRARQVFVRGMTLVRIGQPGPAVPLLEEALRRAPGEAAILAALADAHAALGATDTALYYAEAARTAAPDNPAYHHEAAVHYRDAGRTAEAAEALEAAIALRPHDADALQALAALRTARGEHAAARDALVRLRTLRGDDPDVLAALRDAHLRLGDEAGLEAALRDLLAAVPADEASARMLADLLAARGEDAAAADVLRDLLAAAPDAADAAVALDALERRLGRPPADGPAVTDAPPDVLVARAAALVERGDADAVQRAEALLRQALVAEPDAPAALALLGRLLADHGDPAEGAALLRRALAADPRDLDGWARAVDAFVAADDPAAAVAMADEALLLFPGQPPLLAAAARALLAADRPADALAHAQRGAALLDADGAPAATRAAMLVLVGDAHARLGDEAASRAAWRAARDLAPTLPALRSRLGDGG